MICQVCFQPECVDSGDGVRPAGGAMPSRLGRGGREYRGYCEWAVHPDEAVMLLHRGYAVVDGARRRVWFIHNERFVTQVRVQDSDVGYVLEEKFVEPSREAVCV